MGPYKPNVSDLTVRYVLTVMLCRLKRDMPILLRG